MFNFLKRAKTPEQIAKEKSLEAQRELARQTIYNACPTDDVTFQKVDYICFTCGEAIFQVIYLDIKYAPSGESFKKNYSFGYVCFRCHSWCKNDTNIYFKDMEPLVHGLKNEFGDPPVDFLDRQIAKLDALKAGLEALKLKGKKPYR